jgi:[acyl-carrier-protein] S-malonyltransferase
MTHPNKIAFLFPGQGAQYVGMAKDFYENFPKARETFQEADDILHRKISKIILEGPQDQLTETRNSQVGIYVASLAILNVIRELYPNLAPCVCAGLSLGEYTALTASGRIDFSSCLSLVQYRGQYMNEACELNPGTMAVVLGLEAQVVEELIQQMNMPKDLWAANFNCPGQVVISGTQKGVDAAGAAAKAKGAKRILPLQVHGAFHSGLMKPAEERLAEHIHQAPIKDSTVGFVMNVPGKFIKDTSEIKTYLIQQVTSPVRWEQSVRCMGEAAVDLFIEIGCGKVLTAFTKRILPQAKAISIEKIEELDQIAKF